MRYFLTVSFLCAPFVVAGCGHRDAPSVEATPVVTSGKIESELDAVPAAVLAAVYAAEPDFEVLEAEFEQREDRQYYDVGGRLPDGSEWEFDMLLDKDGWRIVERQRDILPAEVPGPVMAALRDHSGDWRIERVIESDQGDGLVIFEFFGPGPDESERKVEVKWENDAPDVLTEEWAH